MDRIAKELEEIANLITANSRSFELMAEWEKVDWAIADFQKWCKKQDVSDSAQRVIWKARRELSKAYRMMNGDLRKQVMV